jgi:Pregnancy-associated plasma protein-A
MDATTTNNGGNETTTTATASSKIVIPVWFHVLQWDDTWGKLATEQVEDLFMPALEAAYSAKTPFAFQLKGVTSTIHRKWYYCKGQNRYKKRLRRGGKATLNVYVCDMVGSLERGGDAYFPYVVRNAERAHFDGIRIMNPALGGAHYAAQALVHEVGHYLGLLHTFEVK